MVALGERTAPTGQELLAEFIQYGHQQPFEEIVRRYAGMVFNVCFRVTKDKHEAEDATQAVFLTLALQARRGADIKALGPWLQQVAKRLSLDSRRSKKRRKTREERHHVEQTVRRESILGDTLPTADMDELKTILHEELQKLPAKYRMPLILHYFGGLSRDEMAAELNCKASTLGVRIFRGREMLAGRLSGRGINISAAMLAVAMGYAVKQAISDNVILSTSHAATAMMAGYEPSAYASANVIALTRHATLAVTLGKARMTAITLMLAGTSLGAGVKVLGVLPTIGIQRIITTQMNRLLRPLLAPLSQPLRVDSQKLSSTTTNVAAAAPGINAVPLTIVVSNTHSTSIETPVPVVQVATNSAVAAATTAFPNVSGWRQVSFYSPVTESHSVTSSEDRTALSADISLADATDSSSGSTTGGMGGGFASPALALRSFTSAPTHLISSNVLDISNIAISSGDLVVGTRYAAGHAVTTRMASNTIPTASQATTIQIPVQNGTLTESNGILMGWGASTSTGTLTNNGQVVANGEGVDRTLKMTSYGSVQTQVAATSANAVASTVDTSTATIATPVITGANQASNPTSSPAGSINTEGWYAINHGRLSLGLEPLADNKSVLTWGENPGSSQLALVNSVRLHIGCNDPVNDGDFPTALSLLAPDRMDAPSLEDLGGVPIGLWQVDSLTGDLFSAEISVCYDAMLADELGASSSSIELWTLGNQPGASWEEVNASTLLLDTRDHVISGYADDISFFAVTAIPAPGADVNQLIADHLSVVGGPPAPPISAIPEPVAIFPILTMGIGLLGRRRRRAH